MTQSVDIQGALGAHTGTMDGHTGTMGRAYRHNGYGIQTMGG